MIAVVMITKNAARHLDRALSALRWCDDIVVLDCGSDDATCAIARTHGARVEHQDWLGFGPQKRVATALARHDWVLSIDADEVLEPAAIAALQHLDLGHVDPGTVFAIRRRTFIGDHEIRYGTWNPDWSVRLFNRTRCGFSTAPVHEVILGAATTRRLAGSMLHYSFTDLADLFKPTYARLKSQRYRSAGRHAGAWTLTLRFGWSFLRSLVLKHGWRDGAAGVIVAASCALDACLGLALASESETPQMPS